MAAISVALCVDGLRPIKDLPPVETLFLFFKGTVVHFFFFMSKCRQFEGLSTGIFTWTIPNHTIKLQLHRPRHLIIRRKKKKKILVYSFSCLSGVLVEGPQRA